jgi:hypothetical protein
MTNLVIFAAQTFFIACVAWIAATAIFAVRRINRPWQYSIRHLFVFVTIVALTTAMATAFFRGLN